MVKINKWKSFALYFAFFFTKVLVIVNLYLFTYMFNALKHGEVQKFIIWVSISVVSSLITYALCYFRDVYFAKVTERYKKDLRDFIFKSHSTEEGQKIILNKPGSFKSITIENVDMYVEEFIKQKYLICGQGFGFLTALGILTYFSWMVALSVSLVIISCIVATMLMSKKLKQNRTIFMEALNEQDDMFSNMLDLRSIFYLNSSSMKLAKMFNKKYMETQNVQIRNFLKFTLYYTPNVLANQTTTFAITAISSLLAVYGIIPLEALASIIFITSNLVGDARDFSYTLFSLSSNKNLNEKFTPGDDVRTKCKKITTLNSLDKISFTNYNFTFEKGDLFDEAFNFDFEKGKKYAIVGESGTGKSTVINSLIRKNVGFNGNIELNNDEFYKYDLQTIIKNIGILNSTPYVFDATLFQNITMFEEGVEESKVQNILEKINFNDLELHKKINLKSISEGQKQKINLARVMFKDPDWIISDEGFSNMDSKSREKAVEYIIDDFKGGIINITHHLKKEEEGKYDMKINF